MLLAGTITGAYGIQGWVKIHALTDPLENLLSFERWTLRRSNTDREICFTDGRRHGRGLVAKVAGVDTRTEAEKLRGAEIWVADDVLPELEPGDYYWHDLQGLRVHCRHDNAEDNAEGNAEDNAEILLGEVDHLLETGANDVLVLRPCEGSVDNRERLIPYLVGDVVLTVDLEARQLRVNWHPDD